LQIVLVPNVFWPEPGGGVVTWTDQLARHFAQAGHQVAVVVHRSRPELPSYELRAGFAVYRIALSSRNRLARPLVLLRGLAQMYALFRQLRPDIVHVQFLHINTLGPLLLSYVIPFKLVVRACGNDIHTFAADSRFLRLITRWAFRRAALIQFNSRGLRDDARPYLDQTHQPITILGDGADPEEFAGVPAHIPADGRPYVFAMGRFVRKKGFDLLIRAFAEAARTLPGRQLVIAGDGEEGPALKGLAGELGLEDVVHFAGYVDRRQMAAYLLGCELFVLPSRVEPVGIVTLEAMAAGKPVLVTNVGGVPDLVQHGQTGWMVDPDCRQLADGMLYLLARPELRKRLAENGQRRLQERFTWGRIAAECLADYREVFADSL
jgi:glycosyltransferase involved in cell wall biosynthesis